MVLRKGILAVSLLIASTTHAGTFYDCQADKDGVCNKSRFGFGLAGLYLQAYPQGYLGANIGTPWDWGGMIEGNYYLEENTDITLNWLHYNFDYYSLLTGADFSAANNLNNIYAELGHAFDLSSTSTARLSGGIQYLRLNTDKYDELSTSFNDKYQGLGPRVGFNLNYRANEYFSLFTNSAVSILMGTLTSFFNDASMRHHALSIPAVEEKLGVSYTKPLKQGMVSLSTGWLVVSYFNLTSYFPSDNMVSSNLTLSGPFLEAKWRG